QLAVVLDDVLAVIDVQPDLLGGGVEALEVLALDDLAGEALLEGALVAVPDVADGHRGDLVAVLLEAVDDVEVGLAPPADADEGDADALVGAIGTGVAGGGQGCGGPGGGGPEEIAAVDVLVGHREGPSGTRRVGV